MAANFWGSQSTAWEKKRYESRFSGWLYSSLRYRRRYLIWLISQLPEGTSVLEIGCGTGRLYGELPGKNKIIYRGWDISEEAVQNARKKFPENENCKWECRAATDLSGVKADVVISAGLIDWLKDSEIEPVLNHPGFSFHAHSFSLQQSGLKPRLHRIFSFFVSLKNRIPYSPRTFSAAQILSLFKNRKVRIVTHRKLSFGAFACVLPPSTDVTFESFLTSHYFAEKKRTGRIEAFFKRAEIRAVDREIRGRLESKQILEIASGSGVYTQRLLAEGAVSVQCLDPWVTDAGRLGRAEIRFSAVPFENFTADRRYDLILALGVLEFTLSAEDFIRKILFVAAPGARVLVLLPKEGHPLAALYRFFHRCRGLRAASGIETKLTQALSKSPQKTRLTKKSGGFLNNLFIISIDE